jgi:hypothetical protein
MYVCDAAWREIRCAASDWHCLQSKSCLACIATTNEAKPGRNFARHHQMEHSIINIMIAAGNQQVREEIFNHYTQ